MLIKKYHIKNLSKCSLVIATIVTSLGCKSTSMTKKPNSTEATTCIIDSTVLTSGQVRYFKEMDLKIYSCAGVEYFKASHSDVIGTIFSALGVDYSVSEYMFVDIQFYGARLPNGEIEISHIENAELTKNSIFGAFE